MPNDAKFGLFFGMGLVIVVAVLFFRKDLPGVNLAAGNSPIWITLLQAVITACRLAGDRSAAQPSIWSLR